MEFNEIAEKYIKIFIMVMEIAGDTTGNSKYKNIELIIENSRNIINAQIEKEVPIPQFISFLIVLIMLEIHEDGIFGVEGREKANDLIEDMWIRYLREPSNSFLKKCGLPTINSLKEIGSSTIFKKVI